MNLNFLRNESLYEYIYNSKRYLRLLVVKPYEKYNSFLLMLKYAFIFTVIMLCCLDF